MNRLREKENFVVGVDNELTGRKKQMTNKLKLFLVITGILFMFLITTKYYQAISLNKELYQDNLELNQEIGEYEATVEWLEDYLDLLDEIYAGKINEAILKERIEWLEKENQDLIFDFEYAKQMWDDFEIVADELYGYTGLDFENYFSFKYPDVYARVEHYNDLF